MRRVFLGFRLCAVALLACQLGLLTATPIALCRVGPTAAAANPIVCTCPHGAGADCPMHKGQPESADNSSPDARWCAGCGDKAMVILSASAGAVGVLVRSTSVFSPVASGAAPLARAESILNIADPPTSPPPRGQASASYSTARAGGLFSTPAKDGTSRLAASVGTT